LRRAVCFCNLSIKDVIRKYFIVDGEVKYLLQINPASGCAIGLKVLTNEKRGGFTVVSFDRSRFKGTVSLDRFQKF
jgi:hypothetical protein